MKVKPRTTRPRRNRGRILENSVGPSMPPIEVIEVFAPRQDGGALLGPYEDFYPVSHGYSIAESLER
jgi:hypothetical protein